ncbi:MAG: hypothetical protein ABC527_06940, partial [Candidatus Methanosuratincola petrocarbonis]
QYYKLYDTYEVVKPFEMDELSLEFVKQKGEKFLKLINKIADEIYPEIEIITRDNVELHMIEKGHPAQLAKYVYTKLKEKEKLGIPRIPKADAKEENKPDVIKPKRKRTKGD